MRTLRTHRLPYEFHQLKMYLFLPREKNVATRLALGKPTAKQYSLGYQALKVDVRSTKPAFLGS